MIIANYIRFPSNSVFRLHISDVHSDAAVGNGSSLDVAWRIMMLMQFFV